MNRYKPLSKEFLLNRGWCCNFGCLNCQYIKMKLLETELDNNYEVQPEKYPVIIWETFEEGLMSGIYVTHFHYPPKDVDLKSYFRGFQSGKT